VPTLAGCTNAVQASEPRPLQQLIQTTQVWAPRPTCTHPRPHTAYLPPTITLTANPGDSSLQQHDDVYYHQQIPSNHSHKVPSGTTQSIQHSLHTKQGHQYTSPTDLQQTHAQVTNTCHRTLCRSPHRPDTHAAFRLSWQKNPACFSPAWATLGSFHPQPTSGSHAASCRMNQGNRLFTRPVSTLLQLFSITCLGIR